MCTGHEPKISRMSSVQAIQTHTMIREWLAAREREEAREWIDHARRNESAEELPHRNSGEAEVWEVMASDNSASSVHLRRGGRIVWGRR